MYNIVRFYRSAGIRRRVIEEAVTLAEAQRHCSDPEMLIAADTRQHRARKATTARQRPQRLNVATDPFQTSEPSAGFLAPLAHTPGTHWRQTSCLCDCHYGGSGCDDQTCAPFRPKAGTA